MTIQTTSTARTNKTSDNEVFHFAIDFSEDDNDLTRMIESDSKPVAKKAKANGMELYTRNGTYHVRYCVDNKFCTRQYFIAWLHAKLAILEALVVKLSSDLLKDISGKTWQQVIACLRTLYAKIDSISNQLVAIA